MGVMKMEDVPTAKWAKKSEEANWATMAGAANQADFANFAFNAAIATLILKVDRNGFVLLLIKQRYALRFFYEDLEKILTDQSL